MTLKLGFHATIIGHDDPSIPDGTMSLRRMVKMCCSKTQETFGDNNCLKKPWAIR